jgi:hypothetical protein
LQKSTQIATYALSGLICAGIASTAGAQKSHRPIQSVTYNETSDNGSMLFLPQFNSNDPKFKNVTLIGLDVTATSTASIYGTLTNNSTKTQYFTFKTGVNYNLTAPTFSQTVEPTYVLNFAKAPLGPGLPSGASYNYGSSASPITINSTNSSSLQLINSGNSSNYVGTSTFGVGYVPTTVSGIKNGSGVSDTQTTSSTISAKVTYYYLLPQSVVPELGTSISLGIMGLVGGALGLRKGRRRK